MAFSWRASCGGVCIRGKGILGTLYRSLAFSSPLCPSNGESGPPSSPRVIRSPKSLAGLSTNSTPQQLKGSRFHGTAPRQIRKPESLLYQTLLPMNNLRTPRVARLRLHPPLHLRLEPRPQRLKHRCAPSRRGLFCISKNNRTGSVSMNYWRWLGGRPRVRSCRPL